LKLEKHKKAIKTHKTLQKSYKTHKVWSDHLNLNRHRLIKLFLHCENSIRLVWYNYGIFEKNAERPGCTATSFYSERITDMWNSLPSDAVDFLASQF